MTRETAACEQEPGASEPFDVAIIGAGISGIGAAYHLKTQCPDTRFVILEAKETFGGTWVTHSYPGIRSDSDLFTFGYRFKPWKGNPIAPAEEILAYLGEVVRENGIDAHIRYRQAISAARWSSAENLWTLEGARTDTGETVHIAASFLWMCQGYYRHEGGYTPQWDGMETFRGPIVHPQAWPDDLDCADKTVVVVGSGATAATLIPAIADRCRSLTMLQRSPTWYIPARNANDLADTLRTLEVDPAVDLRDHAPESPLRSGRLHAPLLRGTGSRQERAAHGGSRLSRRRLRRRDPLHAEISAWRLRIAFVPDGDLFRADRVREGVRGHGRDRGILAIGSPYEVRQADRRGHRGDRHRISSQRARRHHFFIDGEPARCLADSDLPGHDVHRRTEHGVGVRLLPFELDAARRPGRRLRMPALFDHMKAKGAQTVVPTLRDEERDMPLTSWVDPEDFNPGYLMRDMGQLPRRGDKPEWRHSHDYWLDKDLFPKIDLDDGTLAYG